MVFYTADPHFGYSAVLQKTGRPFATVEEMDRVLIQNWNRVVSDQDTVYLLGDVGGYCTPFPAKQLASLKGHKHLIRGNHDTGLEDPQQLFDYFESVSDFWEMEDGGTHIVLCHYPLVHVRGGLMIHGHLHNAQQEGYRVLQQLPRVLNAGVDVNGFCPVTLQQLIKNNQLFYNDPHRGEQQHPEPGDQKKRRGWQADFRPVPVKTIK